MRSRVVAASGAWIWVPENATRFETADYLLARFPEWFAIPLQLLRFSPTTDTAPVLDEVLAVASDTGLPSVECLVRMGSPDDLEQRLIDRGGVLEETVDVFGLDLTGGRPDLDVPPEVEVRWRLDLATSYDVARTSVAAFGGTIPPEEELLAHVATARAKLDAGEEGLAVGYLDTVAAGSAGVAIIDGVARLWGGGVAPEARGRGVYRAMLDHRLTWAAERGATMALVKGRIETSGPTLRRAGFEAFGQERSYVVPL